MTSLIERLIYHKGLYIPRSDLEIINGPYAHTHPNLIGEGSHSYIVRAPIRVDCEKYNAALKFLKPAYRKDPKQSRALHTEWHHLSRLQHPHIPIAFGFLDGKHSAVPILAMELFDGSVDQIEKLVPRISQANRLTIIHDVAKALDYLNAQGIIHRDVKPGNVFFSLKDGQVIGKLGDFALALDLNHPPTETSPSGTPCTAAPEQLITDPSFLSAQTDQHGLAILAYRLLGAKNFPFTDWTFYLSHQHPNQTLVCNPLINPEAYAVISKGSSFYPQDRYSSCEEFAIALSKAHGMI